MIMNSDRTLGRFNDGTVRIVWETEDGLSWSEPLENVESILAACIIEDFTHVHL